MSPENPRTSVVQDFWSTIWKSSTFTAMGVLLALPGLLTVLVLYPATAGYYIIAGVSMIVYSALRLLNRENDPQTDVNLSNAGVVTALVFVASVLVLSVIGVGIRLGAAAAIAMAVGVQYSQPVAAISLAVLFPVLDRKLATISPYLSISAITIVLLVRFGATVLRLVNLLDPSESKTVEESVLKLSN